jgi:hypothetical protein
MDYAVGCVFLSGDWMEVFFFLFGRSGEETARAVGVLTASGKKPHVRLEP